MANGLDGGEGERFEFKHNCIAIASREQAHTEKVPLTCVCFMLIYYY